ncbi:MAG: N-formylglutamate amidohydrolase [Cyanobacteriota bacterium]|nr:N-formylglutamate amidohydrolase [Cyanobacteriota bacterium]
MKEPFLLHLPQTKTLPIVASIPHSGLLVPDAIAASLNPSHRHYLPNQDWHLDRLYNFLPGLGITVVEAIYSRYVADLNRSPDNPHFGNFWQSIIPEKTAFDVPLYQTLPSPEEIENRLDRYYHPYHQKLQALLDEFVQQFGKVYLLDLHSFLGLIDDEICLGNARGKSCSEFFISTVDAAFCDRGYQVVRNKVFSGGYITKNYGKLSEVEALQIEIRYPTYLNSQQFDDPVVPRWDIPEFEEAKQNFQAIFSQITRTLSDSK